MLNRYIIFLFAVAVMVGSVNAQVRPGVKAGYNVSGVMAEYKGRGALDGMSTGDPKNFHMISGFQVGMIADCPINDAFAIQPGARFAMQGFSDKYTSNTPNIRRFSLFYLQVPVNVQYRLNVAEDLNLLFQAGPYGEIGLFGRQMWHRRGKTVDLNDAQKKKTFGKGNDIQNSFNYGVGAGVGIEFFRFQFMVSYDFGLNKSILEMNTIRTNSGTYHVDMRNHNIAFTLGVIFGRRDPLQNQRD